MPGMPRRFDEGGTCDGYNRFSRGEPIFEKAAEVESFENMDRALAKREKWKLR